MLRLYALRAANYMWQRGVRKNDRVVVILPSLKWHQDRMYWIERLKKLPKAPILPQDGRAADKCENTYEFYRFQRHINQSGWKQIKEIAGEYGVTVSAVLIG